jgi:regulator of sirC expression with transglutaminase-like and TPR domain
LENGMQRFTLLARSTSPPLDELLLALAAEFRPVDAPAAVRALSQLSDGLASASAFPPREQAALIGDLLRYVAGLRLARDPTPDALLLDSALHERAGEPAALAAIYALAAQGAGAPLVVAIAGRRWLVAHASSRTLALDPAQSGAVLEPDELPVGLRPLCPHEIAFGVPQELIDAHALTGDLRRATKAC